MLNKYIYLRGLVYYHLKQYERVIEDFDRAIGLNPNNAETYHWHDLALSKSKKQKLTPGFEVIFAITGLLVATYLLRMKV